MDKFPGAPQQGDPHMRRPTFTIKDDGRGGVRINFGSGLSAGYGLDRTGRVVNIDVEDDSRSNHDGGSVESRIGRARLEQAQRAAEAHFRALRTPLRAVAANASVERVVAKEPTGKPVPLAHVDLFSRFIGRRHGADQAFSNKVLLSYADDFMKRNGSSDFEYDQQDLVAALRSMRGQKAAITRRKNKAKAEDPGRLQKAARAKWNAEEKARQQDLFG